MSVTIAKFLFLCLVPRRDSFQLIILRVEGERIMNNIAFSVVKALTSKFDKFIPPLI